MCLEFLVTLALGHRPSSRVEKLRQKKTSAGQPLPCWGIQKRRCVSRLLGPSSPVSQIVAQTDLWLSQRTVSKEDQRFSDMLLGHYDAKNSMINANQRHLCSRLLIARGSSKSGAEGSEFWDLQEKCLQPWWVRGFPFFTEMVCFDVPGDTCCWVSPLLFLLFDTMGLEPKH